MKKKVLLKSISSVSKNFFSLRHKVADKLIEGMERNKDGTDKEIIITDKEIDRTDMKIER